ncbi:FliI/YscN family ATPase [bacterium]|nr:FliI/YscN family ATPase [bacterium]
MSDRPASPLRPQLFETACEWVAEIEPFKRRGQVKRVTGVVIEAVCPPVFIGELCYLHNDRLAQPLPCEVIGVREHMALLMPFDFSSDISVGTEVRTTGRTFAIPLSPAYLGRVIDGLGRPLDGKGPLPRGRLFPVNQPAPSPLSRPTISEKIPSGIKAIDAFLTWGKGQRLGVMAGSGVGKSTLFGMIARHAEADINVIGLIGERGREVNEFIERDLGEEGLKRSVVIAVPSNESPLLRVKGAQITFTVAEYFRDRGDDVLLLMDSLTRYAYALREIGLTLGEPPTTRGYTPSVYAQIPRLCERAGLCDVGSITALLTILVEGDDMNEPVADIARSVLDGHIVLSRKLLTEGQLPPVDILDSISRVMPEVVEDSQIELAQWARNVMSTYYDAEDLINIGAYQVGTNAKIDQAIRCIGHLREFLRQGINEKVEYSAAIEQLSSLVAEQR